MKCNIHGCEHINLSVYESDYIARKIIGRQKENRILSEIFADQVTENEIDVVENAFLDALDELEIK